MPHLRGRIEFVTVPRAVSGATLSVRLLDVSRADAAASVVVEQIVPGVSVNSEADVIDFDLEVPYLDPRGTYSLEAHLDVDHSGETSIGDYRTMEHIGVTPQAMDGVIRVPLRPVG